MWTNTSCIVQTGHVDKTYEHYIAHGINENQLAPLERSMLNYHDDATVTLHSVHGALHRSLPGPLLTNPDLQHVVQELHAEIADDYTLSQKRAILDYILLDTTERNRLKIKTMPKPQQPRVIRAPMAWHDSIVHARDMLAPILHITNPVMQGLLALWHDDFASTRLVDKVRVLTGGPLSLDAFTAALHGDSVAGRGQVQVVWVEAAADIVVRHRQFWDGYVDGRNDIAGYHILEHLFQSIATLMANQLRYIVLASLQDLCGLFARYATGNAYDGEYADFAVSAPQMIVLELVPCGATVTLAPGWDVVHSTVSELYANVVETGHGIRRVESEVHSRVSAIFVYVYG